MSEQQAVTAVNDPKRILVVDDAADTRLMLNLRLQREGYTVYAAGSGTEALEIVQQEGLPHLVILDIMMPGMDGFAVAAELRRMGDIPIIFLSALSDTNTKVEGLNRYAEDYITKPFAFSELLARVRRVLLRVASDQVVDPELVIDDHLRINFCLLYTSLSLDCIFASIIEHDMHDAYLQSAYTFETDLQHLAFSPKANGRSSQSAIVVK